MTYFIQACVKDGAVFTVRSQSHPVVGLSVLNTMDFAVNAEVDGEQIDAGEVMAAIVLTGQVLSGLPFKSQSVLPGQIGAPIDQNAARAAMQLSRRQVFIGMADAGLITAPEAIAAASVGTPPATVEAAFLAMPMAQQTSARITFGAFQVAYREDPMTALFQATAGMTDTQMDAFFTTYAAI